MGSKHLEGIRVVELGTHVAVPKVSRVMADWGAEVIKVEPPKGEPLRKMGPGYNMPDPDDHNPIFQCENMNKKSITINLKSEEGHKAMLELIKTADVFLSNTRPRSLKKLGIWYEDLKAVKPDLIYGHLTAYGEDGPEKDSPGFDVAAYWAKSGATVEWILDSEVPFKPMPGMGDSTAAGYLLSAINAALFRRERTGEGEFIQASLYSTALWCNSIGVLCGQPRYGHKYPKEMHIDPLFPPYRCKDGVWVTACSPSWDALYPIAFKILGLEDRIGDPYLHSKDAAREHYTEVCALIAEKWAQFDSKDLIQKFTEAGQVVAKMSSPHDLWQDEQAWANDYLAHVTLEDGADLVVPRTPIYFNDVPTADLHLAPQLAVDNQEILGSLGLSEEEIHLASGR